MALLKYLTLKRRDTSKTSSECLPDPSGPLVITMPSGSITAANPSVAKVLEHPETRSLVANTVNWSGSSCFCTGVCSFFALVQLLVASMVHLVAFSSFYLHLVENLGRPNGKELLSHPEQGQLNIA